MSREQVDLAGRYASLSGARAAWFVRADNTADLLAKIALVGSNDHLVVCADDFSAAFQGLFRFGTCSHIDDPAPDAFMRAMDEHEVRFSEASFGGPQSYAYPAGIHAARTFWFVGSIGGYGLRVPDLRALSLAARAAGAILIVDNTVASAFGCRPHALGAHIVLEALDRVAAGRLERKLVAVSVAPQARGRGRRRVVDPQAEDAFRLLSFALGDPCDPRGCDARTPGELDAIAAGLDTLSERMRAHADHARAIAEYLSCHPAVGRVFYPGLSNHRDHALAPSVLEHGFGPAVDFTLLGSADESAPERHRRFVGLCSCANRSARAGGAATRLSALSVRDVGFIRIFAGTDDPLSIVDSLDQALRLFCNPPEP